MESDIEAVVAKMVLSAISCNAEAPSCGIGGDIASFAVGSSFQLNCIRIQYSVLMSVAGL